jgi:conjugal transfer ATP-binding protein TraC
MFMFNFLRYKRAPDYFPWLAYDDDTGLFLLDENYIGFTFSVVPLSGINDSLERRFQALINMELPQGSFLQFNLIVLDDVSSHVYKFKDARKGSKNPLIQAATKATADFISKGAKNHDPDHPVRNSKLLISLKLPIASRYPTEEESMFAVSLKNDMAELLHTIGFHEIRPLNDTELVFVLSQIMNRDSMASWHSGRRPTDESELLRDQILDWDQKIMVADKHLRVGDTIVSSLSPKRFPISSYFGKAFRLSIDTLSGDRGIPCTHMISATVKIEDITKMRPKVEHTRTWYKNYADGQVGRFVPEYRKREADWAIVKEALADGDTVHRFSLNIMLFSDNKKQAHRNVMATRTYLNELNFTFFEDVGVMFELYRANMPLGPEHYDEPNLKRLKLMNSKAISSFMPVMFEWRGTETPLISLTGRAGQVMSFSPFDSGTNYNMTISAESGAGKSFFSNELISAILGTGGKVWVIDVGRSYMKLCESLGGQFISFGRDSNICLNPFSTVTTEEEYNEVQDILLNLLATMAAPQHGLDDFQTSTLSMILLEQYKKHGNQLSIDHIADACMEVAHDLGEGPDKQYKEKRISDIGFGLRPFCKAGQYGRFFDGPANIDFTNNFVLLELEELKNQKHLQTVVLLMLIYQIQNGMYLGDISMKKMMLIDEAWDLLSDPKIAGFIEAGYRRFRKYNGAACIITQSLLDLHDSTTGRAILANSATTLMLQQKPATLDKLAAGDNPEFDRRLCEVLKTVRKVDGRFSEIFIRNGYGEGIGRFVVDDFRALLYSTKPADITAISRFTSQGMSNVDAINAVLASRKAKGRR